MSPCVCLTVLSLHHMHSSRLTLTQCSKRWGGGDLRPVVIGPTSIDVAHTVRSIGGALQPERFPLQLSHPRGGQGHCNAGRPFQLSGFILRVHSSGTSEVPTGHICTTIDRAEGGHQHLSPCVCLTVLSLHHMHSSRLTLTQCSKR